MVVTVCFLKLEGPDVVLLADASDGLTDPSFSCCQARKPIVEMSPHFADDVLGVVSCVVPLVGSVESPEPIVVCLAPVDPSWHDGCAEGMDVERDGWW